MSPTLHCPACGARWHTAARRGRTEAAETCLRCGGPLRDLGDPVVVLERFLAAWNEGDIEVALEFCHPEIEIAEMGELVPGHDASFTGRGGARRWIELIAELWDVEFRCDPCERRVVDEHSVELVGDIEGRSSGEHPDFVVTRRSLWRANDGMLCRVEASVARAAARDAPRA